MGRALTVEQSRVVPVAAGDAFSRTVPLPLPTLFAHRYGPIPPVKAVRDQDGDWGTVGQSRTVVLVGGGSMREVLTAVEPPQSFSYTLTEITGPLAPLVSRVDGQWSFAPADTGSTVTWRWTIHPRSALTAPVLPVFGRLWRGYARRALEELSRQLAS